MLCVIEAVAVALNEAMTPEFQVYQQNILINSRALCAALQAKSYQILTGISRSLLIFRQELNNLYFLSGIKHI